MTIDEETPVILDGYLDDSTILQFRHGMRTLAEGEVVDVVSDREVRFVLRLPAPLEARVIHHDGSQTVEWTEGDDGFEYTFTDTGTDPVRAEVKEEQVTKKAVFLQVTPKGPLPERD